MMETSGHSWWPARIIVLLTGVALGVFGWRAYVDEVPRLYPVTFTHAQWLVAADDAPQGYFRQELYISEPVQQAWVSVAATDSFILYLNGKAVDGKGYASLNVSGIYDIGHYIVPGKNVLGVVARRLSYPGAAMAVLEGVYRDHSGREQRLASDSTWKVSPIEQTQGRGEIPWYAETFDATAWQPARTAGAPQPSELYPLSVHPLNFAMPPQGQWIGQPHGAPIPATFSYAFTVPEQVEDAWLRIAASPPYTLAINDIAIGGVETPHDAEGMRLLRFQSTPFWRNHAEASTDLYRITPWLRAGNNHISVNAGPLSPTLPGLFVDGFVVSGGEISTFRSDATWAVTTSSVASTPHPVPHHASRLAHVVSASHALPLKRPLAVVLPPTSTAKQILTFALVTLGTASIIYLLWLVHVWLLRLLTGGSWAEVGCLDALAHLPTLLALSTIYLLGFDVRFDPAFPFQSWIIGLCVAGLLCLRLLVLFELWWSCRRHRPVVAGLSSSLELLPRLCTVLLLISLIVVGTLWRLRGLDAQSLYHDEVHMVTYVQGLLEKGYPHKMIGPIERPLATYELAPYPIALSVSLLGMSDFALRLPAALLGSMTILLIFWVGQQVFDRRVGLLAAAVYTFCPQALIWAQYLWHPQQTQFLALLTSYLCYQAIRHTPISPWYLYAATLTFIATYLSWEGTGFFLPALGLGLVVMKGRDVSWLRDKHLWIAVGLVSLAVAMQLIRRLLLQVPYLVVGQGLSDVSMPSLYFLHPMYDPGFYIKNFLWLENNVVLTLLVVIMLPLLFKHPGSAYYCTILCAVIFMMTNTLSNAAIRYVYYLQTFLILSSSASVFFAIDSIAQMKSWKQLYLLKFLKCLGACSLSGFVILSSSVFVKLYRLSNFSYPSGVHTRTGVYYIDYRSASQYITSYYQHGDLVISIVADTLTHYANIPSHYFIQTYTMRQVLYDPSEMSHRYLERIVGNPIIRDLDEFAEVISNFRKVWIIATPDSIFARMSGPELRKYLAQAATVVHESYNAKVLFIHH